MHEKPPVRVSNGGHIFSQNESVYQTIVSTGIRGPISSFENAESIYACWSNRAYKREVESAIKSNFVVK